MNDVNIYIPKEDLEKIQNKYGEELTKKAYDIMDDFTERVSREAKIILEDNKDTGDLIRSIDKSVKVYLNKISGEISTGEKYARFIHEGAKHDEKDGGKIKPHFVKFSVAPTLLKWAKRHKVIQQIRGDWYFIDKENKEHLINDIDNSGLMVYTRATKFFEKPFNELKDKFIKEMSELVGGIE